MTDVPESCCQNKECLLALATRSIQEAIRLVSRDNEESDNEGRVDAFGAPIDTQGICFHKEAHVDACYKALGEAILTLVTVVPPMTSAEAMARQNRHALAHSLTSIAEACGRVAHDLRESGAMR